MQKWVGGILFAVILLSFSTIPLTPALPQFSFMITPVVKEIQTKPGEKKIYTLKIINSSESEKKVKLHLYPLDFSLNPQGEIVFFSPNALKRSASGWVMLNPSQLVISSGEAQDVQVKVNIPEEAQGGYYSAIVVEQAPEISTHQQTDIVTWRMVSILVLVVHGSHQPKGDIIIQDVKIHTYEEKKEAFFIVTLENKGDVHVRIQGKLLIKDKEGRDVKKFPLTEGPGTIFPETVREFKIAIRDLPPPGEYVAELLLMYGKGKKISTKLPFIIGEKEETGMKKSE